MEHIETIYPNMEHIGLFVCVGPLLTWHNLAPSYWCTLIAIVVHFSVPYSDLGFTLTKSVIWSHVSLHASKRKKQLLVSFVGVLWWLDKCMKWNWLDPMCMLWPMASWPAMLHKPGQWPHLSGNRTQNGACALKSKFRMSALYSHIAI